jgi:lactoylglutathione lyase
MKFHHAMLRVSNLDAALDFYCAKLGLQEIERFDLPSSRMSVSYVAAIGDIAAWAGEQPPAIKLVTDWDSAPAGGREPFGISVAVDDAARAWSELVRAAAAPCRALGHSRFVTAPEGTTVELLHRKEPTPKDAERQSLRDQAGRSAPGASATRLYHVLARTADFNNSLKFYRDILGFVEVERRELPDYRKTVVFLSPREDAAAGGKTPLAAFELVGDWDDPPHRSVHGPPFHVCFWVPDVYETCAHLMGHGVDILVPPRNGRVAFVRGPDNTSVELVQFAQPHPVTEPWASMEDGW